MSDVKIIETCTDLKTFFYNELESFNLVDIEKELLLYSSDVLSRYAFKTDIDSKALGLEFMKAQELKNLKEKNSSIQEIGEKSLLLSSYFSGSLNRKIINQDYFLSLGQMAYETLSIPHYFNIEGFFKIFAKKFKIICAMISKLTDDFKQSKDNRYVLEIPMKKTA